MKENTPKGKKPVLPNFRGVLQYSWLNEVKQQIVCNLCTINAVKLHLPAQQHKYTHTIHGCKNKGKLLLNACLKRLSIL